MRDNSLPDGCLGLLDDPRDHDREVEKMRDNSLPDGCSAQDYSDKVTELVRDHVGHLERPLEGKSLGKFIIKLMPASDAAEGRAILRDMTADGSLDNQTAVLKQCMDVVRQSESPASKAVAALVVQHRRAVMQLGPAAPMAVAALTQLMQATHGVIPSQVAGGHQQASGQRSTCAAAQGQGKAERKAAQALAVVAKAEATAAVLPPLSRVAPPRVARHARGWPSVCLMGRHALVAGAHTIMALTCAIDPRTPRSIPRTWTRTPRWSSASKPSARSIARMPSLPSHTSRCSS